MLRFSRIALIPHFLLAEKFDLRELHDVVLLSGLVLAEQVESFIQAKLEGAPR